MATKIAENKNLAMGFKKKPTSPPVTEGNMGKVPSKSIGNYKANADSQYDKSKIKGGKGRRA